MTITQLEYVLALDEYRHFKKASESCHVTQPTLSMQLQKLEDELGVVLFDRSKNPILPTLEGEKVIKQARVILKEFNKIEYLVENNGTDLSGQFRLGIIPTLSPYVLPLFLSDFIKEYPSVELIIEELKTEDILLKLSRDELDAALLVTPLHDEKLIERVLFYEPFYVFAHKDDPLYLKKTVQKENLDFDSLWLLKEGHCLRTQMLNLCKREKEGLGKEKNLLFEGGSLETLKNIVSKSGGYTLLPHLATMELNSTEKKMVRPFRGMIPNREVSLVYERSFLKESIIDAIEQSVVKNLPDGVKSLKSKKVEIIEI